jgi:hypothetical protein
MKAAYRILAVPRVVGRHRHYIMAIFNVGTQNPVDDTD